MSLKSQILIRFKTKFPAVNLSNTRLNAIADKLDAKITDENQIDERLDAINEITPFDEMAVRMIE